MKFALDTCVWELTLACCFNCAYCGSRAGKPRESELTTDECLSVARQLHDLGCRRVSLIGGEVFLRPDWDIIADELTGSGVACAIITNGFTFSEELISRLKNARIESVAVSIDGPKRLHDKYRREGSYLRAVTALGILHQNGVPTSVITTLNSENAPFIEELYAELEGSGISAWQIQACSPMGNASSGFDFRFDVRRVMDFVARTGKNAPFIMGVADNIGYYTEDEGCLRGSCDSAFTGCRAGLTAIGIDSVGNVRGCESMYDERFIEGNLRKTSLREIWENPEAFAYNRKFKPDMLTGACASCPMGPVCAGGCRSYNSFVHGKPYEAPFCARNV